jgi:shikimate dehydrogenase
VTIPHKQAALALATDPTRRAVQIGAANTLLLHEDGTIAADNTDAPALTEALPVDPAGKRALVLGAGGSARAAVYALQHAGAAEVLIWNRTPARADELARDLEATPAARIAEADLLVNCTSIGLDANDDPFKLLPLPADAIDTYECVVDYVYGEGETRLVQEARRRGKPAVDGLELLLGQGALSFTQFTGHGAPIEAMRAALARA